MENSKIKMIAFYLPQFHPFKQNDEWWGKGFTEWTNVAKAKPLFKGHYQPKVPADLGFYDLRVPEVREEQAQLAKEAGIYGFCYWHYWFNGTELMERPFYEVVNSGKPDFPFCIGWANESWMSKMWNKDGSLAGGKTLIEQTYGGEEDAKNHFMKLLPAFKDQRYIKVDNSPLVFIHRAMNLPEEIITLWNQYAKEHGFSGIHFVGRLPYNEYLDGGYDVLKKRGFNAVTVGRLGNSLVYQSKWEKLKRHICSIMKYNECSRVVDYIEDSKYYIDDFDKKEDVYPAIYPNWDHSPRSGKRGLIVTNSTPHNFSIVLNKFVDNISNKDHNICFLKSWNEWGEGNYVEPDYKFGKEYLDAIKSKLK